MELENRKLGKFIIYNEHFYSQEGLGFIAHILKELNFIPLRVECLWANNCTEYCGISDKFDEINKGSLPTEYNLIIKKVKDDKSDEVYNYKLIKEGN